MTAVTATDTKIITQALAPTEEEKREYKRRLFESADRSYLNDRLNVDLPPHLYGEWIGTDDFSQYNAQQRGFVDGTEYLSKFNKLHETSDGRSVIGDVKFMVVDKWKHEAQQEIAMLESARKSGLNASAVEKMEEEFAKSVGIDRMPTKQSARVIDGDELNALLKR
jgi:hypothetical protein